MTFLCFLMLPAIQVLAEEPEPDVDLTPAPEFYEDDQPEFEELEPEEPEEPEEPDDSQLDEELPPPDLDSIELALGGDGLGSGYGVGAISLDLGSLTDSGASVDELLGLGEVEEKARPRETPVESLPSSLARRPGATVTLLFEVLADGRVGNAKVVNTTDSAFDEFALRTIRRWRFDPATAKGEPVASRLRLPLTFNN